MSEYDRVLREHDGELARLRAALDEAERRAGARAAFLAATSHELREPMSGVLGMARLLGETVLDEEQRGYVDTIVDSAETLLTVVNDVLDLSRVDAGRLEIVDLPFELGPLLQRLEALLAPRARQKGLELLVRIEPGLPRLLRGDPGRLRQVLLNLIGNAVKFTDSGRVEVVAEASGNGAARRLRLTVSDTGPGIAPAAMKRLFTAFGQGDAAVSRLYGGSGLGLMIAQRMSEAMSGTLEVASPPGGGACFLLDLPLHQAEPTDPPDGTDAAVSLGGASLLIVDAQRRTRELVRGLAAGWGMAARGAERAGEALVLLHEAADRGAPYDFVVCDRQLPDLGGEELARRVRDRPPLAHTALVMLAASGMRGDALKASAAGFDAYLPKPVRAETLLDCLRALRRKGRNPALITAHSLSDSRPPCLRVLLVDDNAVNIKLARIMLERAGHHVEAAADGAAALAAVAAGEHDLVLMDVQMPVMDGFEATRRIRALTDAGRAAVPIVAVTANALQGDAERCLGAGMNGYVGKPFDRASLIGAVERWGRRPSPAAAALDVPDAREIA
jgi:CheY-like chemotaxis protein/nitrogen-specific signal transduction histidine kinase